MMWKHRNEEKTIVRRFVESVGLLLSPILRKRLDEEDGPTAVDDLEAHAADRSTPEPDPSSSAESPSSEPDTHAADRRTPELDPSSSSESSSSDSDTQTYENKKRAKRRLKKFEKNGRQSKIQKRQEHVQLSQQPALVESFDSETLPSANGAYSSLPLREDIKDKQKSPTVEELLAQGFRYIAAEDVGDSINSPRPIIDSENRIFSSYAGMPFDDDYKAACARLCAFIQAEQDQNDFDQVEERHTRGNFPSINFGISQGNGKGQATRLKEGKRAGLIQRMRENRDLQRIASFQDSVFQLWAPKLYQYYWDTMQELYKHTHEERNFAKSVFACATMNFGPNVRAYKHRDMLNLAFGWCAITALGFFNHTLGGHLILWEAKLIVEFPAGSTYLIPSSCLSHSNTATQSGEWRASFTQYTAGGVFRWVENGFRTDDYLWHNDRPKYHEVMEKRKERWDKGLEMFSTLDELLEPL